MGATATAALVFPGAAVLAHVGDSRVYQMRDGTLKQLTTDQTYVGRLLAQGHISFEEAQQHEQRHVLLQAVGTNETLEIDVQTVLIRPGDRVLLCSDGLYDLVSDEAIAETLGGGGPPLSKCRALVTAANSLGGFDNTTVIVLEVVEG
jgi:protein phosphatase